MKVLVAKAGWVVLALSLALVVVVSGCGGDKNANIGVTITPATPSGTQQPPVIRLPRTADFATLCQKSSDRRWSSLPPTIIDPTLDYTATIKTEKGDITIDLFPDVAPITVNNFVFLACSGFYDGVTFHRVLPGLIAQAGDPTGTGSGGPGYTLPDEFNSQPFDKGTVGMATTGAAHSAGSQFFICLEAQPSLNGGYTAFGKVTNGLDVLDKLTPRDPATDPEAPPGDEILEITVQEH